MASGQYQTVVEYGGQIQTSSDYGANWTARDSNRRWISVSMDSTGQYQLAAVYGGHLYTSSDYGANWTSRDSIRKWCKVSINSSGQFWYAVAANDYIYESITNGVTWSPLTTLPNLTAFDKRFHSISASNRVSGGDRTTIAVSTFGSNLYYKRATNVWASEESPRFWTDVSISGDGLTILGLEKDGKCYMGAVNVLDESISWSELGIFGNHYWFASDMDADGSFFTMAIYNGVINGSYNGGSTFYEASAGTNKWTGIAISSNGAYQIATTWGDKIYISSDSGAHWSTVLNDGNWYGCAINK
jgi:hypothetical protein